jgi:hypothetical protein
MNELDMSLHADMRSYGVLPPTRVPKLRWPPTNHRRRQTRAPSVRFNPLAPAYCARAARIAAARSAWAAECLPPWSTRHDHDGGRHQKSVTPVTVLNARRWEGVGFKRSGPPRATGGPEHKAATAPRSGNPERQESEQLCHCGCCISV